MQHPRDGPISTRSFERDEGTSELEYKASLYGQAANCGDAINTGIHALVSTLLLQMENHDFLFIFVYLVEARMRANTQRTARGA